MSEQLGMATLLLEFGKGCVGLLVSWAAPVS